MHVIGTLRSAIGLCLIVVLGLGLGMAGARHNTSTPGFEAAQSAVLAIGGSLSDLCGDFDDHMAGPDCPLCHLVASATLPDPAALLHDADLQMRAKIIAPDLARAELAVLDPGAPPRGPPLV